MTPSAKPRVALIGYGNIAHSLFKGLLAAGWNARCISLSDPIASKFEKLGRHTEGIRTFTSNKAAVAQAAAAILCIKPGIVRTVCAEIKEVVREQSTVLLSVAAGVSLNLLQKWTTPMQPIVRCMPNTAAAVGCAATALYANRYATNEHKKLAEDIFSAVGSIVCLQEEQDMHIITALSGSGPAYFFRFAEALEKAAKELGCDAEKAQQLVTHTLCGAAMLAAKEHGSLATLRKQITSKGGTTERGLHALEQADIDQIAQSILRAAHRRSVEISKRLEDTDLENTE